MRFSWSVCTCIPRTYKTRMATCGNFNLKTANGMVNNVKTAISRLFLVLVGSWWTAAKKYFCSVPSIIVQIQVRRLERRALWPAVCVRVASEQGGPTMAGAASAAKDMGQCSSGFACTRCDCPPTPCWPHPLCASIRKSGVSCR